MTMWHHLWCLTKCLCSQIPGPQSQLSLQVSKMLQSSSKDLFEKVGQFQDQTGTRNQEPLGAEYRIPLQWSARRCSCAFLCCRTQVVFHARICG